MQIPIQLDTTIIDEFLTETDTLESDTMEPKNYLRIGEDERYPLPATSVQPRPDPNALVTVEEFIDLVIALRNKYKLSDEEILKRLETQKYSEIGYSDIGLDRSGIGRPKEYWPTDMLLTVPHHILGATLTEADLDQLEAINAEKEASKARKMSETQVIDNAEKADEIHHLTLSLSRIREEISELREIRAGGGGVNEMITLRLEELREEG